VSYFPTTEPLSLKEVDAASGRVLDEGMDAAEDPVFLSTLRVSADAMAVRHPEVRLDDDGARILRSVLMKPEHEAYVDHLHEHFEDPVRVVNGRYLVPSRPGYSITIKPESRERYAFPDGANRE